MLKIKHQRDNKYVVNGMTVLAKNFKEALAEYLLVHGGSRPIFAKRS